MPKFSADPTDAETAQDFLHGRKGLSHLRVRKRGDLLTIVSGDADDVDTHARVRRVSVQYWRLEMPAGTTWEPTPFHGPLREILATLADSFGWTLEPRF